MKEKLLIEQKITQSVPLPEKEVKNSVIICVRGVKQNYKFRNKPKGIFRIPDNF